MSGLDRDAWLAQIFGGSAPASPRGDRGLGSTSGGTQLPPAPTLESSSSARKDEIAISWQWPAAPSSKYEFELRWRDKAAGAGGGWRHYILGRGTAYRHTIGGLQPNTAYTIGVQALSLGPGDAQPLRSPELHACTVPEQPSGVTVVGTTSNSVSLRWQHSGAARWKHFERADEACAQQQSRTRKRSAHPQSEPAAARPHGWRCPSGWRRCATLHLPVA